MPSYLFARKGTPSNTAVPQGATAVPSANRMMRSLALDGAGMTVEPSNPATVGAGGSRWWAGPPQNVMYIAYIVGNTSDATGNNTQPVAAGATNFSPDNPFAGVGFWGKNTGNLNDTALFLEIGRQFKKVQDGGTDPGPFASSAALQSYLITLGAWSNYTGP